MSWKTPKAVELPKDIFSDMEEPVLPLITRRSDLLKLYFKLLWKDSKPRILLGLIATILVVVGALAIDLGLLGLLLPVGMAWVAPTTRSTGDLITAAIWNQDVVDNSSYLLNRPRQLIFTIGEMSDVVDDLETGWYRAPRYNNGPNNADIQFFCVLPDDFVSIDHVIIRVWANGTDTWDYNIEVAMGGPGEAVTTHTSASSTATASTTNNQILEVDITARFADALAGDSIGLWVEGDNHSNNVYFAGIDATYIGS